jgi:hypothetical protein
LEQEYGREKTLMTEELRVSEVIRRQQEDTVAKLLEELKEIKQVLKVPRLHFKYLEKLEFDELVQ